eukprot:SAG31_NODE_16034_length_726_cov_1.244019_1_plen_98_part_00
MHYYKDGGIGSAVIESKFVPGHEFAARVVEDDLGVFEPGQLVAVDPARPCGVRTCAQLDVHCTLLYCSAVFPADVRMVPAFTSQSLSSSNFYRSTAN